MEEFSDTMLVVFVAIVVYKAAIYVV